VSQEHDGKQADAQLAVGVV